MQRKVNEGVLVLVSISVLYQGINVAMSMSSVRCSILVVFVMDLFLLSWDPQL